MAASSSQINRKRKTEQDYHQIPRFRSNNNEENENENFLTLSLSSTFHHHQNVNNTPPPPPPPPPLPLPPMTTSATLNHHFNPPPPPPLQLPAPNSTVTTRQTRARRNPSQSPREGKSATVPPPFPWATNLRATVHSLNYLLTNNINTINGDVQCKRCERQYTISYNLQEKFKDIGLYIAQNKARMHDRAPVVWMNPSFPACRYCDQENSAKPVIADKKKAINWLFLLLGQMLGCCTLDQLKYFCKHTKNHRTGAKDRVLYLTYLGLCKQLNPNGPFDHNH